MTVSSIIEMFGTLSDFAGFVGVPISTASSWKSNDYIPEWRQKRVLEEALANGVPLSTADFPTESIAKRMAA